jgi:hypothetical protein
MTDAKTATILFADLMNPDSNKAKSLTLQEYDEMIVDFQSTLSLVTSSHLKNFGYVGDREDSEWSIAGDELSVFLYSGNPRFDVRNALILAVKLKLGWLTSVFNQKIFMEGRPVSRISVGINCGGMIKDDRQGHMGPGQGQYRIEREAIRVTKRIESKAREGTVYQVMVGKSAYQVCNEGRQINVTFSEPIREVTEGQKNASSVYEVVSLIDYEIVPTMPDSMKDRLTEAMEYTIVKSVPEPWIYFTLLRYYISRILSGEHKEVGGKAVKLADQALKVLEYKKTIYNILGWLYIYCDSLHNQEKGLQYFEKVLELDPQDRAALLHRTRILEKREEIELSGESFEDLLRRNPERLYTKNKQAQDEAPQLGSGLWEQPPNRD